MFKLAAITLTLLALSVVVYPQQLGGFINTTFKPESDDIDKLASQAMMTYLKENNQLNGLKFSKVLKAQTQVVSGVKYRLTIELLDGQNKPRQYLMDIWVKAWENFAKVTDFQQVNLSEQETAIKEAVEKVKMQIETQFKLGQDYNYQDYEVLDHQIVSGIKLGLKLVYAHRVTLEQRAFIAKVWIKPWENFYNVTHLMEQKRASNVKLDKQKVLEIAAQKAVEAIRAQTNLLEDIYPYEKYQVLSTQVVNGMIYEMKITFYNKDNAGQKKDFRAKVWVKPWLDFYEVQSVQPYKEDASKPDSPQGDREGGWSDCTFDMKDEQNKKLIVAMNSYLHSKQNLPGVNVDSILKCKSQVVSGIRYHLNALLSNKQKGSFDVYTQPWSQTISVETFFFQEDRPREDEAGGWTEVPMSEIEGQILAKINSALNDFFKQQNLYQQYSRYIIMGAQQQIVNGINYRMRLELLSANPSVSATKSAEAMIHVQPKQSGNSEIVVTVNTITFSDPSGHGDKPPQGQMTGGYTEIEFKDLNPTTQKLIIDQINQYLQTSNAQQVQGFQFGKVIKAQSQVVNGINFRLQVQVAKDAKKGIIEVVVYMQPAENSVEVT